MVYLHFPTTLTPEELLLKDKYGILRKKKKALQDMKAPKPEPEKVNPLKRQLDPKDAKELAKKLLLSGKLSIPSKPTVEKTVFKRSRILERKLTSTGRTEGHGGGMTPGYASSYHAEPHFEPFQPEKEGSSSGGGGGGKLSNKYSFGVPTKGPASSKEDLEGPGPSISSPTTPSKLPKSFFQAPKEPPEPSLAAAPPSGGGGGGGATPRQIKNIYPKRGPTLYIGAQDITEDVIRTVFGQFGKIVNVKVNSQNVGFVSFESAEIAEKAIKEVHGTTHNDSVFDVQFARRQPSLSQLLNESPASASWSSIATLTSNKGPNHEDKRKQVVYDPSDELF